MAGVVKVSEAATIAIHSLVFLAVDPTHNHSAKDMARAFGLSLAHLAKVMQRLVKAGMAVSTRGPSGGFRLARPSREISLLEILELMEGPLDDQACLLDKKICAGSNCVLGDAVHDINVQVRSILAKQTLSDVAESFKARSPMAAGKKPG